MSDRREFSRKVRAQIILRATDANGIITCEGCGLKLGRRPYEIDHRIAEALIVDKSQPLTAADGQLLGKDCCHRGGRNKTADDIRMIRKAERRRDKDSGAYQTRRPMPGSKRSKWKFKIGGGVVRRDGQEATDDDE